MPNIIIGKEEAFSKGFFFTDEVPQSIDLSNASYNNESINIGNVELYGTSFNDDGTKLFCATSGGPILQFDLSTGFDLSTATDSGITFDPNEFGSNQGLSFNGDGTEMLVLGGTSVYAYNLGSMFDISNVSYAGRKFDITKENIPKCMSFNADGTKMFIAGQGNLRVYQYSLSTGFDLSTVTFDNTSYSISNETSNPFGLTFNIEGTKMFVTGHTEQQVFEYSLGSNFDVSTASFESSFDVSGQIEFTTSVSLGDNDKIFVGSFSGSIYQYSTA